MLPAWCLQRDRNLPMSYCDSMDDAGGSCWLGPCFTAVQDLLPSKACRLDMPTTSLNTCSRFTATSVVAS